MSVDAARRMDETSLGTGRVAARRGVHAHANQSVNTHISVVPERARVMGSTKAHFLNYEAKGRGWRGQVWVPVGARLDEKKPYSETRGDDSRRTISR